MAVPDENMKSLRGLPGNECFVGLSSVYEVAIHVHPLPSASNVMPMCRWVWFTRLRAVQLQDVSFPFNVFCFKAAMLDNSIIVDCELRARL